MTTSSPEPTSPFRDPPLPRSHGFLIPPPPTNHNSILLRDGSRGTQIKSGPYAAILTGGTVLRPIPSYSPTLVDKNMRTDREREGTRDEERRNDRDMKVTREETRHGDSTSPFPYKKERRALRPLWSRSLLPPVVSPLFKVWSSRGLRHSHVSVLGSPSSGLLLRV